MKDPAHVLATNPEQTVILVVDDEVMIVNIARTALEGDGHFVLTAQDGEEALEMCRKFPGPIHLVVSDVGMPNMNGIELRERITVERPTTKVLLMSGEVDSELITGPFLRKPFAIDALKQRVRQLLASAAAGYRGADQV